MSIHFFGIENESLKFDPTADPKAKVLDCLRWLVAERPKVNLLGSKLEIQSK